MSTRAPTSGPIWLRHLTGVVQTISRGDTQSMALISQCGIIMFEPALSIHLKVHSFKTYKQSPPPKKKTPEMDHHCHDEWKIDSAIFLLFRDLIFLYYSLRDTLLKYIKTPCYDISSITTHNATDVTDLIKQLPATIGNTKATDVWLCMYTTFTEEKPHKKSTKKKS